MNHRSRIIARARTWRRACCFAFTSLIASLAAWGDDGAASHQSKPAPRVAIVLNGTPETHRPLLEAFAHGMNELGDVNRHGVALDVRWANSQPHRLPEIISELLDQKPGVLVVAGSQAAWAARNATKSIPIVMASVADPVAQGLVASLAR